MTTYTIIDTETGDTTEVDTAEEVPSAELFTFVDEREGKLYWSEVAHIEGATDSLVAGKIAEAKLDLAALGLELVGNHRELNPYDTGERAEPKPWIREGRERHGFDPDDFGRVDFDDDEGLTVATIHLSKRDDGGYTVHIIPTDDHETCIEWHGEYPARLIEEN